jgi:hypothetical protein
MVGKLLLDPHTGVNRYREVPTLFRSDPGAGSEERPRFHPVLSSYKTMDPPLVHSIVLENQIWQCSHCPSRTFTVFVVGPNVSFILGPSADAWCFKHRSDIIPGLWHS